MDSGVDGNRPGLCAAEALRSPVISMGNVDSAHDTVTRVAYLTAFSYGSPVVIGSTHMRVVTKNPKKVLYLFK
jgi:hypothetical protein